MRNSEFHYAPWRPRRRNRGGVLSPRNKSNTKPQNKPYSSIALESPAGGDFVRKSAAPEHAQKNELSFSTTIDLGGEFAASRAATAVVLDTGAAAKKVCRAWIENRNLSLGRLARTGGERAFGVEILRAQSNRVAQKQQIYL